MAKARLNPLFASISGKIGDIFVAERQGKFFVRKLRTRTTPPSPKELQRREVFRQAAAYGKMVQDDCGLRAVYARTAKLRQTSPYQVAVTDFLKGPTVDESISVVWETQRARWFGSRQATISKWFRSN